MTRSFPPNTEAIRVRVDEKGQPVAVAWRDREYRVEIVVERRDLRIDWSAISGEIHRVYFTIVAPSLRADIYRDDTTGGWFLASVDDQARARAPTEDRA